MTSNPLDFTERPSVLVVDDTPDNLTLMSALLKDDYKVKVANSGERALRLAMGDSPPDLILLDIMMPEMDGYEVCTKLKEHPSTRDIPIIFLTAKSAVEDERMGLEMGAADYITKPISPPIVLARVATQLENKAARDFLKSQNTWLESEVSRRAEEITRIQDVTILAMASLAETRDNDTGNHIRRTQHYVRLLALKLRRHPRFSGYLDDATIDLLFKSAPLHDIGKVGIPDRILLKPGRLTPEEFEIMKTHAALGHQAIVAAESHLDGGDSFLAAAKDIAWGHHEKWDGSGYPRGLSGDDIPPAARLMAVADVYDALICRRVYKEPIPHKEAVQIILAGKGGHFDPDIVDAFIALQDEFDAVAQRYADSNASLQSKMDYLEVALTENP